MYFLSWFKFADDSDYLLITGAWIDELKIKKKALLIPGQTYTVIELPPVNCTFKKYLEQLLVYRDKNPKHVEELVQGVIEGETRVLAASITTQEVLRRTKEFEQVVIKNVQLELNHLGLFIYNASVTQFVDVPRHMYFS